MGGAALCSGAWCAGLRFPAIKSDDSRLHPYISSAILKPYFRFLKERPDVNSVSYTHLDVYKRQEAIRATVKEKMELFGSVGKANA